MHIFLLFLQKLERHRIQRIAAQLVISLHDLQHIQLDTALQFCVLRVARSVRLGREVCVFGLAARIFFTSQKWERGHFQSLGTVQQVGKIKVGNVIPNDHIRIHTLHKVGPRLEKLDFSVKRHHMAPHNVRTRTERENVLYKGRRLALPRYHIRNLNDRVHVRVRKHTLPTRALDIEAKRTQRRHLEPLVMGRMRHDPIRLTVELDLAP